MEKLWWNKNLAIYFRTNNTDIESFEGCNCMNVSYDNADQIERRLLKKGYAKCTKEGFKDSVNKGFTSL